MPTTSVEICNLALAHLGEAPITALDTSTAASRACVATYEPVRDEVLRSHRWNFAAKRAALTQGTTPAFGWGYSYTLPNDCLRVWQVNGAAEGESKDWVIEGRAILSDADTCTLLYGARVTDVSLWDALFVQALGLRLAMQLSEIIRGTTGKTAELQAQYERVTAPLARRIDANEARRQRGLAPARSAAIRARFGNA